MGIHICIKILKGSGWGWVTLLGAEGPGGGQGTLQQIWWSCRKWGQLWGMGSPERLGSPQETMWEIEGHWGGKGAKWQCGMLLEVLWGLEVLLPPLRDVGRHCGNKGLLGGHKGHWELLWGVGWHYGTWEALWAVVRSAGSWTRRREPTVCHWTKAQLLRTTGLDHSQLTQEEPLGQNTPRVPKLIFSTQWLSEWGTLIHKPLLFSADYYTSQITDRVWLIYTVVEWWMTVEWWVLILLALLLDCTGADWWSEGPLVCKEFILTTCIQNRGFGCTSVMNLEATSISRSFCIALPLRASIMVWSRGCWAG